MNLRRTALARRWLAFLLIAATLAMKAALPAGMMPRAGSLTLEIAVCADASGGSTVHQITIPRDPAAPDHGRNNRGDDGACPFAALALAGLTGGDPAPLAAVVTAAALTGIVPVAALALRTPAFLRPQTRAPPRA